MNIPSYQLYKPNLIYMCTYNDLFLLCLLWQIESMFGLTIERPKAQGFYLSFSFILNAEAHTILEGMRLAQRLDTYSTTYYSLRLIMYPNAKGGEFVFSFWGSSSPLGPEVDPPLDEMVKFI